MRRNGKIDPEIIKKIIALNGKIPQSRIAERFGVGLSTVERIIQVHREEQKAKYFTN